jgi:hypothetical protein
MVPNLYHDNYLVIICITIIVANFFTNRQVIITMLTFITTVLTIIIY